MRGKRNGDGKWEDPIDLGVGTGGCSAISSESWH